MIWKHILGQQTQLTSVTASTMPYFGLLFNFEDGHDRFLQGIGVFQNHVVLLPRTERDYQ